ncbi:DUF5343 domain-containing protein [Sulfuritalea hydrogenivorans]|uniref:DUF5343 domain-containing protein n=1 Tax=Sulfuritalea hydrogenivorans sk43H TaxID=1223802 RepID=W0SGI7_9PROT|nr:DUF5343 domain-containing protein [Sulfuritalea hydrogenivorans]BAO30399.1 hypothetical protein SUTH_02617 [Sulfuritalea hydrogenivorans sk43H]
MAASLPYLSAPGAIKTALEKIRSAATPERVTKDFVSTVLQIKGGTGGIIPPYLKRIGFVGSDGAPTDLYKRFRNPATGGAAVADAIRIGYRDLLQANEFFHLLSDRELQALITQVTGAEADSRVTALVFSTLKNLKTFADFDSAAVQSESPPVASPTVESAQPPYVPRPQSPPTSGGVGLNLSYTINLNLPATSDQAVFNAIFRSLKEHILSGNE